MSNLPHSENSVLIFGIFGSVIFAVLIIFGTLFALGFYELRELRMTDAEVNTDWAERILAHCTEVLGEYAGNRMKRVGLQLDSSTPTQPKSVADVLSLGWSKLAASRGNDGPRVPAPTLTEIDDEFSRVQRALGAPELGAPPWGSRAPTPHECPENYPPEMRPAGAKQHPRCKI